MDILLIFPLLIFVLIDYLRKLTNYYQVTWLNMNIGNPLDEALSLEKSFIRDLVIQILCYVSEKEQENVK